ncbi:hypothetical protein ACL07V_22290 [Streptomyces sp. MB22_4]|uniref:hypothetical protein n=1 Tax=Streptomyces sp. MB22_4 TaxID=3383120 RepID=UPI0039A0C56D
MPDAQAVDQGVRRGDRARAERGAEGRHLGAADAAGGRRQGGQAPGDQQHADRPERGERAAEQGHRGDGHEQRGDAARRCPRRAPGRSSRSPLSETSRHVLVAGGQDLVFGLETSASRIAHLAAVDALTHLLMSLRPETARRRLDLSADITADHAY